jgi:hypothetical protein
MARSNSHTDDVNRRVHSGCHRDATDHGEVIRPIRAGTQDRTSTDAPKSGYVVDVDEYFDTMAVVIPASGLDEWHLVQLRSRPSRDSRPRRVESSQSPSRQGNRRAIGEMERHHRVRISTQSMNAASTHCCA